MGLKVYKNKFNFKAMITLIILFILLFLVIGNQWNSCAFATETNDVLNGAYISENNYKEDMKNIVEPYMKSKLEAGYLSGDEEVKLYYEKYKVENASKVKIPVLLFQAGQDTYVKPE